MRKSLHPPYQEAPRSHLPPTSRSPRGPHTTRSYWEAPRPAGRTSPYYLASYSYISSTKSSTPRPSSPPFNSSWPPVSSNLLHHSRFPHRQTSLSPPSLLHLSSTALSASLQILRAFRIAFRRSCSTFAPPKHSPEHADDRS